MCDKKVEVNHSAFTCQEKHAFDDGFTIHRCKASIYDYIKEILITFDIEWRER